MKKGVNISNISEDSGKNGIVNTSEEILARKHLLLNKSIGISISESDNLRDLGFDVPHLKDLIIETARYILASGGKLVYGGDMRSGGFTELIFDLLNYYKSDGSSSPNQRFFSYLAWPVSLTLSQKQEAELKHSTTFVKIPHVEGIGIEDPKVFLPPSNANNSYIWARCLSCMRVEMELNCDARIFVGGKSKEFKGKYPGVLEELIIALENKHPVYLVGAFGGVTKDCISLLNGKVSDQFSTEYYLKDQKYKDFYQLYNERHPDEEIVFETCKQKVENIGWKGVSELNGLSIEDNKRLSVTPHIPEIIQLVMKGFANKFSEE